MALKFSVQTDGMDAIKDALAQGCSRAEHILAVQVLKDTAPFVPMRKGSLRQRTHIEGYTESDYGPGGGSMIVYPGPYARYLYYGKLYVDPLTGSSYARKGVTKVPAVPEKNLIFHRTGTCSHWFEASKAQNMEKWVRVAEKAVKRDL
mgnify:CR=1 FL=1